MHSDRCYSTRGQKCRAEGSGKEAEIQELMYRDTTNVEQDMCDYTGNNLEPPEFSRLTTRNSYTWNITHRTESTAM